MQNTLASTRFASQHRPRQAEQDERTMEEAVLESINEGLVRGSKLRARQEVRSGILFTAISRSDLIRR